MNYILPFKFPGMFFYGYVLTQLPGGRLAELVGAKWLFGGGEDYNCCWHHNPHFPQRGLNLKSCVLPISLQEPLKHL